MIEILREANETMRLPSNFYTSQNHLCDFWPLTEVAAKKPVGAVVMGALVPFYITSIKMCSLNHGNRVKGWPLYRS